MRIAILTDDKTSWFVEYGKRLMCAINSSFERIEVSYLHDKAALNGSYDILFLLSCCNLLDDYILSKNKHNIVVHASNLPEGRGFAPLQWQILEGKNNICLTLFEANTKADDGPYYFKEVIGYSGNELYHEMRSVMGEKIISLCLKFIKAYELKDLTAHKQSGNATYYRKRKDEDNELDINKSIKEQFNLIRIADNIKHPLYFNYLGRKYLARFSVA